MGNQIERIQSWAKVRKFQATSRKSPGNLPENEVWAIHHEHAAMAIAELDPRGMPENVKGAFERFKRECAAALSAYFTKGVAVNPRAWVELAAKSTTRPRGRPSPLSPAVGRGRSRLIRMLFRGTTIRLRGEPGSEQMCLTDMWRANGSPSGRGPSDWRSLEETKRFLAELADAVPDGIGFSAEKGGAIGGGGTWAHWQLAFGALRFSPSGRTSRYPRLPNGSPAAGGNPVGLRKRVRREALPGPAAPPTEQASTWRK